jgi:hypothetical protein
MPGGGALLKLSQCHKKHFILLSVKQGPFYTVMRRARNISFSRSSLKKRNAIRVLSQHPLLDIILMRFQCINLAQPELCFL